MIKISLKTKIYSKINKKRMTNRKLYPYEKPHRGGILVAPMVFGYKTA
jgi:hypothetical protein